MHVSSLHVRKNMNAASKIFQLIVPATHYYNTHSLQHWLGLDWAGLPVPGL